MARTRHSTQLGFLNLEDRTTPAAGALDTTFGVNGMVTLTFPDPTVTNPAVTGNASVVQADGKILIAGTTGPNTNGPGAYVSGSPSPDFAVTRLNVNGSIDTTFGVNGRVVIPFDVGTKDKTDIATSIGLQSDGRIIVAGSTQTGAVLPPVNDKELAVARLNPDGSLDTTFGTNGKVTLAFNGAVGEGVSDLAIMPDDRIVLVGDINAATPNQVDIVRLEPTGQLDTTFGGTGQVFIFDTLGKVKNAPIIHQVRVTLEPDSSIVAAYSQPGYGNQFLIFHVSVAGALDFNFNGGVDLNALSQLPVDAFGMANGVVGDISIQPDGKILVAGGQYNGGNMVVVRYTATGFRDTTFGNNSLAQIPFALGGTNTDIAEGIDLQPDGKIVLGGKVQISGGSPTIPAVNATYESATARLTTTGTLDTTFGTGGKQAYPLTAAGGVGVLTGANSSIFTTGGKILLAGSNSTQMSVIQVQNSVTFNPLPTAPVPAPPQTVPSPGTTISQIAVSAVGPALLYYQSPDAQTKLYNPNLAANFAALGAMGFFDQGLTGTIRTAVADVNGDGIPDIAVATGPGTPTRWAVINGANPTAFLIPPSVAFRGSEEFSGGAFVSAGDIDGDGKAEIVISADQGGGPRITIYSFVPTQPGAPTVDANFFGIADQNFTGGVRTAVGDLNGDGVPDLAVAAGIGGGPRIAIYNGLSLFTTPTKLTNDFFAFDSSLRDGSYVAIGDVNGDGFGDLVVGAGDGGAPRVLVASGQKLLDNPATGISSPIDSFFVGGDSQSRGGVRVAVKDVDGDSHADIVTGSGQGQESQIRIYRGVSATKGEPSLQQVIDPFNSVLVDGVYVG